jgi:3-oxoacyl-[acyl-carrier-protein] synthase II
VRRRVVVTGLGAVTPLSCDVETLWTRLLAGESGVTPPIRDAADRPPMKAVSEMKPDELDLLREEHPEAASTGEMRTFLGVAAGSRAVRDAGLDDGPHLRAGAMLGVGPGVHRFEDVDAWLGDDGSFDAVALANELDRLHPESILRHGAEEPSALLARLHGLRGPVGATVTACAAANQAIGLAFRSIRRGETDWCVSGGTDGLMNPMGHVFFVLLGADARASRDPAAACRPFDRRRTGLVMGEGAAGVVLEELEHAKARGARIYAEVAGYGSSLCAFRATAPHPEGRGAASCMAAALEDGGIAPEEVDYLCAHGTGTKRNDPAESQAVHTVFGDHTRNVAVSALKGALGHLLAGAAGVGFLVAALATQRDVIPPTVNLTEPDPVCDLDFVTGEARHRTVRVALNNGFGFGGQNSTIALRKYREEA